MSTMLTNNTSQHITTRMLKTSHATQDSSYSYSLSSYSDSDCDSGSYYYYY